MQTVKFTTNLPLGANPAKWIFDPIYFESIPKKSGVYIVGVKIDVKDQGERFCPLYTGINRNLQSRIRGHWDTDCKDASVGELNSCKELFELNDPFKFYPDIKIWDDNWSGVDHRKRKSISHLSQIIETLIWFPDNTFFDVKIGGDNQINPVLNRHNVTISPIYNLFNSKNPFAKDLLSKIILTKRIISTKYFYCYCEISDKSLKLNDIEGDVKNALKKIGIYTYAKAKQEVSSCQVDLSEIQDVLVNMTVTNLK
jgi:hypothetical protein